MTKDNDWPSVAQMLKETLDRGHKSVRTAAEEIGVNHATLLKIADGKTSMPHPRTREAIRAWLAQETITQPNEARREGMSFLVNEGANTPRQGGGSYPFSGADDDRVRALVGDPGALTRMIKAIPASDYKARMAVIRECEDILMEHGLAPWNWPRWFHDLKMSILFKGG